jgi:hypothetical protein
VDPPAGASGFPCFPLFFPKVTAEISLPAAEILGSGRSTPLLSPAVPRCFPLLLAFSERAREPASPFSAEANLLNCSNDITRKTRPARAPFTANTPLRPCIRQPRNSVTREPGANRPPPLNPATRPARTTLALPIRQTQLYTRSARIGQEQTSNAIVRSGDAAAANAGVGATGVVEQFGEAFEHDAAQLPGVNDPHGQQ